MKNMMQTIRGQLEIPGWDELQEKHPTRALVLQAMINLELRAAFDGHESPKQTTILAEVNRLGGKLSPKSVKIINEHIHNLIDQGYVVYKPGSKSNEGRRGRGGPASPWRTKYVAPYLRSLLENKD
jgi:hypothetical protein